MSSQLSSMIVFIMIVMMMIAWESGDTWNHLLLFKNEIFNLQLWPNSILNNILTTEQYAGDDDDHSKVHKNCRSIVNFCHHHHVEILWERCWGKIMTMILLMTGTTMTVVRSEQRILSWMIGIRYIEGLILSVEAHNGGDLWLELCTMRVSGGHQRPNGSSTNNGPEFVRSTCWHKNHVKEYLT